MKTKLLITLSFITGLIWSCDQEPAREISRPNRAEAVNLQTLEVFEDLDLGLIQTEEPGIRAIVVQGEELSDRKILVTPHEVQQFFLDYETDDQEEVTLNPKDKVELPVRPIEYRRAKPICESGACSTIITWETQRLQIISDQYGLTFYVILICCEGGIRREAYLEVNPQPRFFNMDKPSYSFFGSTRNP